MTPRPAKALIESRLPVPLVSVIVPAFNAQSTLDETLDTIARQSHTNIEILIVDDGSTDATPQISAKFCAREPRARLLLKPNGGVASARNHGINKARGAFIAPIDADDLWHPDHLAKLLEKMLGTQPTPALVFAHYQLLDINSNIDRSGPFVSVEGCAISQMAYTNLVGNGSALLFNKSVALGIGGYDERLRAAGVEGCEDYLLQLSIAARFPIASVNEYLVGYRTLPNNMSSDRERMVASMALARTLFRERFPDIEIPEFVWQRHAARDMLTLARYRVRHGRLFGAARAGVEALWLDPIGTLAAVEYEIRRRAVLLVSRRPVTPVQPKSFLGSDPTIAVGTDPFETAPRPSWLPRVQQARMRQLKEIDDATPLTKDKVAAA